MKTTLDLTKIVPVTISDFNRQILKYKAKYKKFPKKVRMTVDQLVCLEGLFNFNQTAWTSYRGIPIDLVE